jgi:16S rRNA (guanine527-N7)-methyltransferase
MEIDNLLEEGLSRLGLLQDRTLLLLTRYIEEIELFNQAYGLVKVKDRNELIVKHILDSLAPLNIFGAMPIKKVADIGSGAGLPGIPLAICMPDADFTLIERMGRRAGFLRNAIAVLGLSNVKVEEADMERLSVSEKFDLIVFRAFKPLDFGIQKGLSRLLAPDGIIAAYKGRRQTIDEEMEQVLSAVKKRNGSDAVLSWELVPLKVPYLEEERHLVLMRNKA